MDEIHIKTLRNYYRSMSREKKPLCFRRRRGKIEYWGLTTLGLMEAIRIKGGNLTGAWIEHHTRGSRTLTKSPLWAEMVQTLSRSLPTSVRSHTIEDHIQQCLTRLIHRDALADWLLQGNSVTHSRIAGFALRSAYTDCRDSARNPVCRTLMNARTVDEVRRAKKKQIEAADEGKTTRRVNSTSANHGFSSGSNPGAGPNRLLPIDIAADAQVAEVAAFRQAYIAAITILRKKRPKSWEYYKKTLDLQLQGYSAHEIAKDFDLGSRSKVRNGLIDLREVFSPYREQFM